MVRCYLSGFHSQRVATVKVYEERKGTNKKKRWRWQKRGGKQAEDIEWRSNGERAGRSGPGCGLSVSEWENAAPHDRHSAPLAGGEQRIRDASLDPFCSSLASV